MISPIKSDEVFNKQTGLYESFRLFFALLNVLHQIGYKIGHSYYKTYSFYNQKRMFQLIGKKDNLDSSILASVYKA